MLAGPRSIGRILGSGEPRSFEAKGRGVCLLAFHGFTGTPSELMPTLLAAEKAGFAVRAPLLPGHGTTPSELQTKTFADWAGAAREHLAAAAREHERVVVMGFSMGSLVALQLAIEAPEGLSGLVVMANALFLALHSGLPLGFFHRLKRTPDAYLLKPQPADLLDRSMVPSIVTYDRHPLRAAREVFSAGVRLRDKVSRIRCSTLVLHGERDRVCPASNARWLADRLTLAESVTVRLYPRSAHVVACDYDREEVASDVVSFLKKRQTPVEP